MNKDLRQVMHSAAIQALGLIRAEFEAAEAGGVYLAVVEQGRLRRLADMERQARLVWHAHEGRRRMLLVLRGLTHFMRPDAFVIATFGDRYQPTPKARAEMRQAEFNSAVQTGRERLVREGYARPAPVLMVTAQSVAGAVAVYQPIDVSQHAFAGPPEVMVLEPGEFGGAQRLFSLSEVELRQALSFVEALCEAGVPPLPDIK